MEEKKTKTIELYKKYKHSGLPPDGWFQHCYYCSTITSYTIEYTILQRNYFNYKIMVFLCPHCKEIFNNGEKSEVKHSDIYYKIENYIQAHIFP